MESLINFDGSTSNTSASSAAPTKSIEEITNIRQEEMFLAESNENVESSKSKHRRRKEAINKRSHKCLQCKACFTTDEQLELHIKVKHNNELLKCDECDKAFRTIGAYNAHRSIHKDDKPFICKICNGTFKNKYTLKEHYKKHNGVVYTCQFCARDFNTFANLQIHEAKHTGDLKNKFKCNICEKYLDKSKKLTHMRIHTGEKPYKCSMCASAFSDKGNLTQHYRIHTGEKPYKCEICSKEFRQNSALTFHKRSHVTYKPFECKFCGCKFGSNEELVMHLRVHGEQKMFKCSYCDLEFQEHSNLKSHIRLHTFVAFKPKSIVVCKETLDIHDKQNYLKEGEVYEPKIDENSSNKPHRNANLKIQTESPVNREVNRLIKPRKRKEKPTKCSTKQKLRDSRSSNDKSTADNKLSIKSKGSLTAAATTALNDTEEIELQEATVIKKEPYEHIIVDMDIDDDIEFNEASVKSEDSLDEPLEDIFHVSSIKEEHKESVETIENISIDRIDTQIADNEENSKQSILPVDELKRESNSNDDVSLNFDYNIKIKNEPHVEDEVRSEKNKNTIHTTAEHAEGKKRFQCEKCPASYARKYSLFLHNSKGHANSPKTRKESQKHQCAYCSKFFAQASYLVQHIGKVHPGNFVCTKCDLDCIDFIGFKEHQRYCKIKKTAAFKGQCSICDKIFKDRHSLEMHENSHNGIRPFECDYCGKRFSSKYSLKTHIFNHVGILPHKCDLCEKSYAFKGLLTVHVQLTHADNRHDFKCNICGDYLKSRGRLYNHMQIHREPAYKCSHCGKGFKKLSNCKLHETRHLDTADKKFPCEMCEKSFVQKIKLICHIRTHTGERPHLCTMCPSRFADKSNLVAHMRIHTGIKPYRCSECNKEFAQLSSLKVHKKIHIEYKPFKCEYCAKEFALNEDLIVHLRVHGDVPLFKCNFCDKVYEKLCNLNSHRRLHKIQ